MFPAEWGHNIGRLAASAGNAPPFGFAQDRLIPAYMCYTCGKFLSAIAKRRSGVSGGHAIHYVCPIDLTNLSQHPRSRHP